jgi:DNA-binding MarR family transcriptional regulator
MTADKRQRFAPLPARAARDLRLGARHWRALAVIALHDQLDKNGTGCWASQRRLAELLGVDETQLSHMLTDLRAFGYIVSMIHPTDRRKRVHRVVYNEQDKNWDRNTCRTPQVSRRLDTCAPAQASEADTCEKQAGYLLKTGQILAKNVVQIDASGNGYNDLGVGTYVNRKKHISKNAELNGGTDCAEARTQSAVTEAEAYLGDVERLAASPDRDSLKFERPRIEQLASDACLPGELNERAARLLSQIGLL